MTNIIDFNAKSDYHAIRELVKKSTDPEQKQKWVNRGKSKVLRECSERGLDKDENVNAFCAYLLDASVSAPDVKHTQDAYKLALSRYEAAVMVGNDLKTQALRLHEFKNQFDGSVVTNPDLDYCIVDEQLDLYYKELNALKVLNGYAPDMVIEREARTELDEVEEHILKLGRELSKNIISDADFKMATIIMTHRKRFINSFMHL